VSRARACTISNPEAFSFKAAIGGRHVRAASAAQTAQPTSVASLRQRLDNARTEITRLQSENHTLRNQLARHLGTQRAAPSSLTQQRDNLEQPAVTAATCLRRVNP
jgi:hypothetical protein